MIEHVEPLRQAPNLTQISPFVEHGALTAWGWVVLIYLLVKS